MATVTQKEIAEKLGVTRVLVSQALAVYALVAERTQLLVQQTAREMGYVDALPLRQVPTDFTCFAKAAEPV